MRKKSQRYFSQIDFAKGNYVNGRHFLKIVYCSFRRCRSSWNLKKDLMHSWADEFCTGCFNLRLYRSNDGRKRRILTSSIIQLSGSISSSRGDLEGRFFLFRFFKIASSYYIGVKVIKSKQHKRSDLKYILVY